MLEKSTEQGAKKRRISAEQTNSAVESATKCQPMKSCGHWVQRKKRFCKMTVAAGRDYCGEHEPAAILRPGDEATSGHRIPCPLDSKHTVYEKNLHKHLKICNAREISDVPPYIVKGLNTGEMTHAVEDYSKLRISELDDEEFYGIINTVKTMHCKFLTGQIGTLDVQHSLLADEIANEQYGKETKKHLQQASALLGILEKEHQLQDSTSFVEFGAGKGQLAFYMAKLLVQHENSHVVLLDRMSLRHKKDNKIEDKSRVHRIRVDIGDLQLCELDWVKQTKRNVAVSKHLCGAATDLTLRCITQPSLTKMAPTDFVMIALCCHHRCEWQSFVGKQFLQEQNISVRQFTIITKMVSWAICGTGLSRERRQALEQQEHAVPHEVSQELKTGQRLSLEERESIGFMCKRVLDYARLEFLRQHGYEASLQYYVPKEVTLENVCLLATKQQPSCQ